MGNYFIDNCFFHIICLADYRTIRNILAIWHFFHYECHRFICNIYYSLDCLCRRLQIQISQKQKCDLQLLNSDLAIPLRDLQIIENSNLEECKESITADNHYFQKLELLCKEQHIYTDCTLNREKVAEQLGISAGYVSQIVNTITADNFANYINNYRVEAVKEMISNSEFENYNLLAMGLESGFTSKTTFYKAFKKLRARRRMNTKTPANKYHFMQF